MLLLADEINGYLNSINHTYNKRSKKTTIFDGIIYKLLYGMNDTSQQLTANNINAFMGRTSTTTKISRQGYVDRENLLDIAVYKKIYSIINDFSNKHFFNNKIQQAYAVDGTQINLSKNLTKDGFNTTKNGDIVNGLVLGVYNVVHNYPISLELVTNKDERMAFLDFIKNKNNYNGSIFIFDRGFVDSKLFKVLNNKNINYVCRLRENSLLLPKKSNDHIVHDQNGDRIRVIKYTINNNNYYLATNLYDSMEFSIDKLKDLYHKRWSIEEYFKYIKKNTKFDDMNERSKVSIMKTIYAQLIVSRIVHLLSIIKGVHPTCTNMIVNKTELTKGVYNKFLFHFIYRKKFSRGMIRKFLTIYASYILSQKGRQFERISIKPFTKWYVKRYLKNYLEVNKKKKIKEQLSKKDSSVNIIK